jgi:deoxyribodipyrimidine photolyase-like uncharacterized protein
MSRLRLILGDQLNINHSWFREPERSNSSDVLYVLMEVRSETDYVVHLLEVIQAALNEFTAGRVSIATTEGFVRQI